MVKKQISEQDYIKYYAEDEYKHLQHITYNHWLWSSDSMKRIEFKKLARKRYEEKRKKMKLIEKDLMKITNLRRKYDFLKGLTRDEILEQYLSRCEYCGELEFRKELKPIRNWNGKTYNCCDECEKEILNDGCHNDYELTQEEYDAIYQEEKRQEVC